MLYRLSQLIQHPRHLVELQLIPEADALSFQAGQFIELLGDNDTRLPYSIGSAPAADGHLELFIREQPDDKDVAAILNPLRNTKTVQLAGPFGRCVYQKNIQQPWLFVAGGTGFSQIKAIVEQAIENEDARQFHFYWIMSGEPECFHQNLLKTWSQRLQNFQYKIIVRHKASLVEAVLADWPDLTELQMLMSGPWSMIDAITPVFLEKGLCKERLYSDRFDYL